MVQRERRFRIFAIAEASSKSTDSKPKGVPKIIPDKATEPSSSGSTIVHLERDSVAISRKRGRPKESIF